MTEFDLALHGLTVSLVGAAALWDLRTRRIPNLLTLPAALLGLGLHVALDGQSGAQQAAVGWVVGLALLLLPCLLGWVGGGDVKLLAAIGAVQGPRMALTAGLYGILAGGLLSLAIVLVRRVRRDRAAVATGPVRKLTLPYGPALALGTLVALVVS